MSFRGKRGGGGRGGKRGGGCGGSGSGASSRAPPPPREAPVYQLYRQGALGEALDSAVADMVDEQRLSEEQGDSVMAQFDRSVAAAFALRTDARATATARIDDYKHLEAVWQFSLADVSVTMQPPPNAPRGTPPTTVAVDRLKLVACDGRSSCQQE